MNIWILKLWGLVRKEGRNVLDVIGLWLAWFTFSAAVGAGLTFGFLLAFSYVYYGS